ncbi:hypothetical protein F5Y18DRAFT_412283 [Xylariaceae sp. FL1019]|nr:hypothetical protein F5Y18DRAFT_412283 [Xylariaceae sp. FL1019]
MYFMKVVVDAVLGILDLVAACVAAEFTVRDKDASMVLSGDGKACHIYLDHLVVGQNPDSCLGTIGEGHARHSVVCHR